MLIKTHKIHYFINSLVHYCEKWQCPPVNHAYMFITLPDPGRGVREMQPTNTSTVQLQIAPGAVEKEDIETEINRREFSFVKGN